ncbi:MAG: DUF1320 family protein [Rhodocyclaceae bacterium]|nr:DUF1320 family protein [Rhodocyclaceae bacterium]
MSAAPYCTPSDMAVVATGGWEELAQRAAQDGRVTGELLELTCTGADRGQYDFLARELADKALARLERHCESVTHYAETFIAVRYRTPLSIDIIAHSDLPSVCATIAVLRLAGISATQDMREAAQWAERYLSRIADGKASLGRQQVQGNDPVTLATFSGRAMTDIDLQGF